MKKIPVILLLPLLVSCQSTPSNTSSSDSTENLSGSEEIKENILDDDYRNYYEIFVYSFCDSNGDGIGDLKGIDSKLPYLRDIGYTGIWLTPIFSSPSYHKYDTKDYFTIDKDFGSMDDLKNLVRDAHKLGIKVILDGVFNHTSEYHPWFEKALLAHQKYRKDPSSLSEEEQNYNSLYVFADEDEIPSGRKFAKAGANDFYYECNFSTEMPELNFDSPFTYTQIQSVIDYYMSDDISVDGFRLDAVYYYNYANTTKNILSLNQIAGMIHDHNGYVVGECYSDGMTISDYYQSDIDSFFWFPGAGGDGKYLTSLGFNGTNRTQYLDNLQTMIQASRSHIPAPFLDNHDMGRMTRAGSKIQSKFLLGLRDLSNGTTFNYYGDEIGMTSSVQAGNTDYKDSCYRTHYYWDDETHEGECNDVPHAASQKEYYPASRKQLQDNNSILNYEKKALKLRNAYPVISRGDITVSEEDEKINSDTDSCFLAFDKTYKEEHFRFLFNFSNINTYTYDISSLKLLAVLRGDEEVKESIDNQTLSLPPYSIGILRY